MAVHVGNYKLVRYDSNADTRTGKPRQPVTAARLYNLADDIGEKKDLASEQPDKLRELQSKWDTWNATLVEPLWGDDRTDHEGPGPGAKGKTKRRERS